MAITASLLVRTGLPWMPGAVGFACLVVPEVLERVVHLLHPAGQFGGQRLLALGDEVFEGSVVLLCPV